MANRLAGETSPYLLQHSENPVDWYAWGEEAFARAREEDRAVLVSIGYSACHWCHVMERESFEDEATAQLMNERFVCIKVDREEHPDVDAIYMDAMQAMTGAGGWPLNAFLTPDGVPFWCGTYFPPEPRQGMPSWTQRADRDRRGVGRAARGDPRAGRRDRRAPARRGGARSRRRRRSTPPRSTPRWPGCASSTTPSTAASAARPSSRPRPRSSSCSRRGEREMALHTLRRMASGGMYDQVGGGFARYSVDRTWLVPHFEKMLYDNALLARAYLHAWQVTGEPLFERVATRDARLGAGRAAPGRGRRSPPRWTPTPRASRASSTSGRCRRSARCSAPNSPTTAIEHFGMTEQGNFEGANIPVRATPDPPHRDELRARLLRGARRSASGRGSTTSG